QRPSWFSYQFGCLTKKQDDRTLVFAFIIETLSRFSCAASPVAVTRRHCNPAPTNPAVVEGVSTQRNRRGVEECLMLGSLVTFRVAFLHQLPRREHRKHR
ncbi:hypothetical protein ABLN85_00315, partial [Mycobacterium tuberculosis]